MKCAIICSGTSVRDQNLDGIGVPKIGINWSYRLTSSDIHVVTSGAFIKKFGPQLEVLTATATARFSALRCEGAFTPKPIAKYMWNEYEKGLAVPTLPKNYGIFEHGWILAGGAPCALQVAVSYNFTEIEFYGLDLYSFGEDHHFYKENFARWPDWQFARSWVCQSYFLTQLKPQLDARGVKVTNHGLSDIFPKA